MGCHRHNGGCSRCSLDQIGLDGFYVRTELEAHLQRRGFLDIGGNHLRRITSEGRRAVGAYLAGLDRTDEGTNPSSDGGET
jgi:hypothetical protein